MELELSIVGVDPKDLDEDNTELDGELDNLSSERFPSGGIFIPTDFSVFFTIFFPTSAMDFSSKEGRPPVDLICFFSTGVDSEFLPVTPEDLRFFFSRGEIFGDCCFSISSESFLSIDNFF